jgi:hypothetical protein
MVRWGVNLSMAWQPVLDHGGTLLICVVAPAAAFFLVRSLRTDARLVSWAFLVPVVIANLALALIVKSLPRGAEDELPRWLVLAGSIGIPSFGALLGTFIPAGHIRVGRIDEAERGVEIT